MSEEVKTDEPKIVEKKKSTMGWAANLMLGTLCASGIGWLVGVARISVPVVATICCGLGGIALGRAVQEKKWIFAIVSVVIMAIMFWAAMDARSEMDKAFRW